jgi:hypothetical protein
MVNARPTDPVLKLKLLVGDAISSPHVDDFGQTVPYMALRLIARIDTTVTAGGAVQLQDSEQLVRYAMGRPCSAVLTGVATGATHPLMPCAAAVLWSCRVVSCRVVSYRVVSYRVVSFAEGL